MPSLTIKDIPPDLYRRLKRRAAEHRRSLASEALALDLDVPMITSDRTVLRRFPRIARSLAAFA